MIPPTTVIECKFQAPKPGCLHYQEHLKRSIDDKFNRTQSEAGRCLLFKRLLQRLVEKNINSKLSDLSTLGGDMLSFRAKLIVINPHHGKLKWDHSFQGHHWLALSTKEVDDIVNPQRAVHKYDNSVAVVAEWYTNLQVSHEAYICMWLLTSKSPQFTEHCLVNPAKRVLFHAFKMKMYLKQASRIITIVGNTLTLHIVCKRNGKKIANLQSVTRSPKKWAMD